MHCVKRWAWAGGVAQLPVQWARRAVFAVANTQRRGIAVEYLARQKALAAPEVQGDDDLAAKIAARAKSHPSSQGLTLVSCKPPHVNASVR